MSKIEDRATQLHESGMNCAQSVLIALEDSTGLDSGIAAKVAAGFGGGVRSGEICGAISGGVMAIGMTFKGNPAPVVKAYVDAMREKFGAVRCQDLKANRISCAELINAAVVLAEETISSFEEG